ncbi:MAG: NAD(P)/FAD-dependent oxidoreductase [Burkholderiales bacterium]|jgi:cation diffusion facilitator CzcD-associated flavoprotein CzcO|nr:NAD(P)/FAD-dependent oxidoreductase [Burkholderiales bacterium]
MNARAENLNAEQTDVVIVGAGFAGLGMAIEMKRQGFTNFIVLEKADDLGGTWRDNHYPGCACDVPSHLYSYSFAQNPSWSKAYSPQPEIWEYLRKCARDFDVMPHMRYNSEVVTSRYSDLTGLWTLTLTDGRILTTRVLINARGPLARPAYPNIKGLKNFKGEVFHSQNWNHDYDLKGKRVAVIGTGASAIQFVPHVAEAAGKLDLYQRTPPWVMPKLDRAFLPTEQFMFKHIPFVQKGLRAAIYWLMETQVLGFVVNPKLMKGLEFISRRHFEKQIPDPVLRAKVTPNYTIGCKRVLYTNNYLPALTRTNVNVLTEGITEVRENGVLGKDGVFREADCIILGTGFMATKPVEEGCIFGSGGKDLLDVWQEGGMQAYKGAAVSGFPNMFFIIGPNTGLGHSSIIFMIESQVSYIIGALRDMKKDKLKSMDVRSDVMTRYNEKLQEKIKGAVWTQGGCSSWYLDEQGRNTTLWPGFTWAFRLETRKFDSSDYVCESMDKSINVSPAANDNTAPAKPKSKSTRKKATVKAV